MKLDAKASIKLAALIVVAVLVVYGALALAGTPPAQTLSDMVQQSVGSARALTETLKEVLPLLIAGIAVFFALRAGLFNIGVEGQFTVGALACAYVGLKLPGVSGMVLGAVAGVAAGALWALPAGLIKAYKGGHEVITTIMLNNIAYLATSALVAGPLRDPTDESPTTARLAERTLLPMMKFGDLEVSSGVILGLLLTGLVWFWLKKTVSGYELQAAGANATAARFAGVDSRRVVLRAMLVSGAIGGLGGAVQVLALAGRFYQGLSSGYGFDALGVAMLAGGSPAGLLPSALLFGALTRGGNQVQVLDQVPRGITGVVLGLLIIIAAAIRYRRARVVSV